MWEQVQQHPFQFPCGTISSGTIAEYFAKKYLEEKHKDSEVSFGKGSEKGWDIQVKNNGGNTLYQVKSISHFNKSRKLSRLEKGFDKLIVISMDCDFFPIQAYLFEDASVLFGKHKVTALTVPVLNPNSNHQNGSKLFKHAKDISEEFYNILAERLQLR